MRRWISVSLLLSVAACGGGGSSGDSNDAGTNPVDARMPADACVPSSDNDLPDSNGTDENCDGIDGDASQSIFVATDGSPSGTGTIDDPVSTISQGVLLAVLDSKSFVLVSKGTYHEQVELAEGVSIYGGYDRARNWQRRRADRATVTDPGPVLVAVDVATTPTTVNVLRFEAEDAAMGESSIAARLVRSAAVILDDVELVAGKGGTGQSGTVPAQATMGNPGGAGGDAVIPNGTCVAGGGATPTSGTPGFNTACSCAHGGLGGVAGAVVAPGSGGDGGDGDVPTAIDMCMSAGGTGGAGAPLPGTKGLAGDRGANGARGDAGYGGTQAGGFSAAGYAPANGHEGTPGMPGAAGGGGGGGGGDKTSESTCRATGGAGGGGASGGCGGAGGPAGGGGGASIGLLIWIGKPTLIDVSIQTSDGGTGGDGAIGGSGGLGGLGGAGGAALLCPVNCRIEIGGNLFCTCIASTVSGPGGTGGKGGSGGPGGAGGGGGGGPSIGIVLGGGAGLSGDSNDPTIVLGDGGSGGAGGDPGNGGANGVVQEVYQLVGG